MHKQETIVDFTVLVIGKQILRFYFFSKNRKELRHFNIGDFMEMGRVLSQVVLDYEVAQENKS